MRVDSARLNLTMVNATEKADKEETDSFHDALLKSRLSKTTDSSAQEKTEPLFQRKNYRFQLSNTTYKLFSGTVKTVETERYKIVEKKSGVVHVYDKQHNNEGVDWDLSTEAIQVDEATDTKFIINDLGAGFFTMLVVDDELEAGLKEALGTDELREQELTGFKVHTDQTTGIRYITANGYESGGGMLVLDDESRSKLDSIAKEYLEQYPILVDSYDEAWFYASFEVRGIAKRTENGIMMIGPNCISFENKDGVNRWSCVFDAEKWQLVKEQFDSVEENIEEWSFWKDFFERSKINVVKIFKKNN